ncbi:MAG: amidohydrolase family protein [Candidatus Binatia bacterium]|nr:amidohydrolase family protein [Candidatus Binatia bacterium]
MHDLVIRGGQVVDGTGAEPRNGDVAIQGGRITAVGKVEGDARRTIDADGLVVTPGFVDIHTHYDAQATWDPLLTPSCWHGVTTAVCGNCGVGFAPARPDRHEWLIGLMEGVEDIPGAALSEGIKWDWESFPEYLDALERAPRALDFGTQVPHGAVRGYVMGDRGAKNEAATADDIIGMAKIVKEGLLAGALGFSTSRTLGHRAVDGEPVPGTYAAEDELFGIGKALADTGLGVFELAPLGAGGDAPGDPPDAILEEIDWMCRLSAEIRRPVSFAMLTYTSRPEMWRQLIDIAERAVANGADVRPQMAGRPFGILAGHQTIANPFLGRPTYDAIAQLPLAQRAARLRDAEVRRKILAERPADGANFFGSAKIFETMFPLGDPPNYEPAPEESVAAIARREGRDVHEFAYELLLGDDARELLLLPILNYASGDCEPLREMMDHDRVVLGLGDGGAHCGLICDASIPTFMLTHWVRDRTRGATVPLERVIHRMTQDTARLYGLLDRGVLAPGYKADLNLIDLENVRLCPPRMAHDLPGGGRRLLQRSEGYEANIVSGEVVMANGEPTGAQPGRLLRGPQAAPVR